jgi:hypothetical protein
MAAHVTNIKKKLSGPFYIQLVIELVCIWIKDDKYELYTRLHEARIVTHNKIDDEQIPEYILSESS